MWTSAATHCNFVRSLPLLRLPRIRLLHPRPFTLLGLPSTITMNNTNTSSFRTSAHSSASSGGRGKGAETRRDDRQRGRGRGGGRQGSDKIDALGRLLTRILRHMAVELRLDMRSDGYVRVSDVLKLNLKTFADLPIRSHSVEDIREAVRRDKKQRFSLLEENAELFIRANQGHTVTIRRTSFGGMTLNIGCRPLLLFLLLILIFQYIFSGVELHRNSAVQSKKQKTKFDHLVLGPAAGKGLSDRLQCEGSRAVNKTRFSTSSIGDAITFATVFTIYNSSFAPRLDNNNRLSKMVTVGNASYNKVERSIAILNVFINFIQLTMPKSNIIILTDPESDIVMDRNGVNVYPIQGEYSRDKLMLQRIKSYIAFLEAEHKENSGRNSGMKYYIFTDSDIAVIDDLGKIFESYPHFDVALTFRNNKDQPLNSGFIAVRGTPDGIVRAKEFLKEVLEIYKSKYMEASRMLGDQLALAWVVKSHPSFDTRRFAKPKPFIEKIGSASVLFLPCALYNWTPPEGAGQFHGMPLDVKVVHFKGSRKRLMLESWNFFSTSRDISDMLCLILMSGRTKYDF